MILMMMAGQHGMRRHMELRITDHVRTIGVHHNHRISIVQTETGMSMPADVKFISQSVHHEHLLIQKLSDRVQTTSV